MFGTSGFRGPVGETVTAHHAVAIGRAVATAGAERVVVGRDARTTGPLLCDALTAGVRECGADVVDVGTVATPTLARSVGWLDAHVGVIVTASHNPPEDNGFKMWLPSGKAIGPELRRAIEDVIARDAYDLAEWDAVGRELPPSTDVERRHREVLREAVGDAPDLSVVVDVGNGAGRLTADALSRAGCTVRTIDGQRDGRFPGRPSEPTEETMAGLSAHVGATDADLGVAHDGDADRMLAVDETGEFVPGDALLAVFAREAAGEGDRVAVPVDASLAVGEAVDEVGADWLRTRVGDVHVAEAATEDDVAFGGEPSGAWIWPDETLCPDGPLAACRLTALVAEKGPLSKLVEEVPEYPIRRESLTVEDQEATMEEVGRVFHQRFDDVDETDGLLVQFGDAWTLVRPSGTQPLVRITAEARDPDRADTLLEKARETVVRCKEASGEVAPSS